MDVKARRDPRGRLLAWDAPGRESTSDQRHKKESIAFDYVH
jgi:hypothetical protein